jgi:DNA repair exonuclease SbcCD nuclease subunit
MIMTLQPIEGGKEGEYDTIYHLADIHVKNSTDHAEYEEVFTRTVQYLSGQKEAGKRGVVAICGDVYHANNHLTPAAILLVVRLFKAMALIMPVCVIAGNHDANLRDKSKEDTLIATIGELTNVHYMRFTGIYRMKNLVFGVNSLLDDEVVDLKALRKEQGTKIAMYHGIMYRAKNEAGYELGKEKDSVKPSDFKDYDLVLLGDVHLQQYLQNNMAYPGSLLQQNFGETGFHGLLRWRFITIIAIMCCEQKTESYKSTSS